MNDFPCWYTPLLENKIRAEISHQTGSVSGALGDIATALKQASEGKLTCQSCLMPLPGRGHAPTCSIERGVS